MRKFLFQNRLFLFVALGFFAFCAGLAAGGERGDEILFFNDWRREPFNAILIFWTQLGEHRAFYAMILAAALAMSFRKALLFFLLGATVIGASYAAKAAFHTPRPARFFAEKGQTETVVFVPDVYRNRGLTSFPSGHSMGSFALWGLLAFWSRRKKRAAFLVLLPIGVAISRIFLVQHFLDDIVAGGLVGLFLAYLFWKIGESQRLFKSRFWHRSILFWNQKSA